MKVSKLAPLPVSKTDFSYQALKFVPAKPGCYALTSYSEDVLYIGLSKNLSIRIRQHLDNPKKHEVTELGKSYFVHLIILENENEAYKVERGWLNIHELNEGKLPPLNSVHSPVS